MVNYVYQRDSSWSGREASRSFAMMYTDSDSNSDVNEASTDNMEIVNPDPIRGRVAFVIRQLSTVLIIANASISAIVTISLYFVIQHHIINSKKNIHLLNTINN